jgi:hypothetical protein
MFDKVKPLKPDGYADHLSGNWNDVPDWAILRINFLEELLVFYDKSRCPEGDNNCLTVRDMSCHSVKHCYPYLCDGSCGHNEIWISDKEKQLLKNVG